MTGFDSILKRMVSKNFKWFLHAMLFYHAKHVLIKIEKKTQSNNSNRQTPVNGAGSQSGSDDEGDSDNTDSTNYEESASEEEEEEEDEEEEDEEEDKEEEEDSD